MQRSFRTARHSLTRDQRGARQVALQFQGTRLLAARDRGQWQSVRFNQVMLSGSELPGHSQTQ